MPFRNDPQDRVLPDTNTLLDAIFWQDGIAHAAISGIVAGGKPIIIEENIYQEARKILRQRRIALGLAFDPVEYFDAATASFLRVPPADLIEVHVNNADKPVARAAVHYKALVLTQDAPLTAQCLSDNIAAKFPWQVLIPAGAAPPASDIVRIVPPSLTKGTIFARVTPGGWLGMRNVGRFTVVDCENVGRLYFDSAQEEWVFEGVATTKMKFPAAALGLSLICVSFDYRAHALGKIVLRAGSGTARETKSFSTTKKPRALLGETRLGSSRSGQDYWNGYIRHLTISPEGMSGNKWSAICEVPDAAPNPMNAGALDFGLLRLNQFVMASAGNH